jgi:hypothetical protein
VAVEIVVERSLGHHLVGTRDSAAGCRGGGEDERREPDLGVFPVRCLKSSTADAASSGVIPAGIDNTAACGVGAIEVEPVELEWLIG